MHLCNLGIPEANTGRLPEVLGRLGLHWDTLFQNNNIKQDNSKSQPNGRTNMAVQPFQASGMSAVKHFSFSFGFRWLHLFIYFKNVASVKKLTTHYWKWEWRTWVHVGSDGTVLLMVHLYQVGANFTRGDSVSPRWNTLKVEALWSSRTWSP